LITATVCIVVILVFAFLFLKLCHAELREYKEFFYGIIGAAVQELRFKGGRAAKANIILSVILAFSFALMVLTDVLQEVREFLDGSADNQLGAKYVLFASLFIFFLVSLCFVFALERFAAKASKTKHE
jgi:hypothetical protein